MSWRFTRWMLVATFANYSKNIALYEISRECVLLKSIISHTQNACHLAPITNSLIVLFEDNPTYVVQFKWGWDIKRDKIKNISFFFARELQKSRQVDVKQIYLAKNLADLFTKLLPISTFEKLVYGIDMRWRFYFLGGANFLEFSTLYSFFLLISFFLLNFSNKRFLTRQ